MHSPAVRRDVDEAVAKLAATRAGAFSRREVRDAGGDRRLVQRRLASGTWVDRGAGTLAIAAFPRSLDQRRWLGLLGAGPGAHLSHQSAAEVDRLDGVKRGLVVVTVGHPLHLELPGVTLHQLGDVRPTHLTERQGYPVTTPARTVVDLAAVLGRARLQAAVEDTIVRRLATYADIDRVLRDVRRRGQPGVRNLVLVLDLLAGEPPPESHLEHLLRQAVDLAGVSASRQHPLPAREHIAGVVDAAVAESRLILEADGRTWHARYQAMAKDRARDREAARLGWQTLRFVHHDLTTDLRGCADDILVTHRQRLPRAGV
jgi:very-short-patch-repair endonuclease